jgi:hypothetical protein
MNKKLITGGLLAGLVAGSGAGMILTSTGFAGASGSGVAAAVVVDDSTGSTGNTDLPDLPDRPDRSERLTDVLQPLVDDGTITAGQLDAVVAALDAAGPMGPGGGGRGMGMDGMGRGGEGMTAVAEALGVTEAELRTALQSGQSLAEVAAAEGVEVQTVVDTLVTAAGAHLAEHVTAGDLTQDEADAKLAEMTSRITDAVNNGGPLGGPMGGARGEGGRGPRGHHGPDAPGGGLDEGTGGTAGTSPGGVTVDDASA